MIRGLLMAKGVDPLVIESAMPLVELAETKVKKRIPLNFGKVLRLHCT